MESEYEKHMPALVAYAQGVVGDDAQDVAHDAFLEVMTLPDLPDGEIGGLLMQRTKWRASDFARRKEAVLEADLGETDDDSDTLRPMQLEDLEAAQVHHGAIPPWPSAIEHDTPEEIVNAAQMRDEVMRVILSYCSQQDYSMFMCMADGMSQARIAKEFNVDQTTVSRAIARVRDTIEEHIPYING
jgi:RNA polymerase sigma factor (sigma-70 family)